MHIEVQYIAGFQVCVGELNSYDIKEKETLSIVHGPDYIQFNWQASCKISMYKFTIWNNPSIYYLIHEVSKYRTV